LGQARAEWSVIAELAQRLGLDLDVLGGAMASQRLFEAIPWYEGLTLEEIGGKGVRPQEREVAVAS
jgi:NADH-quinone oxidoreductase subunit G